MAIVCEGIPEFRTYDLDRIAVSVAPSRGTSRFGIWAHVIPLRYVGGGEFRRTRRWGREGYFVYEQPRVREAQPEARYLMTFLVPRFFRLTARERLETVVHELLHLHPLLRGDLRRFPAPHIHHGPTPAAYRRRVKSLTAQALRNFPSLWEHPLVKHDEAFFAGRERQRYAHPRRVFRWGAPPVEDRSSTLPTLRTPHAEPSAGRFVSAPRETAADTYAPSPTSPLASLWKRIATGWLAIAAFSVTPAEALTVRTLRKGNLYAQPSVRSEAGTAFLEDARYEAIRLSPQKTWVQVKGPSGTGWIPRSWVERIVGVPSGPSDADADLSMPSAVAAMQASGGVTADGDFDGPGERVGNEFAKTQELKNFDSQSDRFFARQSGRLYDKPSTLASRFGIVEKDDEVKILSRAGEWSQVRLMITGEEGWYPSRSIRRTEEARVRVVGRDSIDAVLGWGTKDRGWGLAGSYGRNVMAGGSDRPRDRLEIYGALALWLGTTQTFGEKSQSAFFTQIHSGVRYMGSSDDGRFAVGGELGLSYTHVSRSTTGITDTDIGFSLQAKAAANQIGLHVGALGLYVINPTWSVEATVRAQVATDSFASAGVGGVYRF